MTANERDLGVDVVHGCFPELVDSTLSILPLFEAFSSKAAKQLRVSFLAN